jgi:hypothetical protein
MKEMALTSTDTGEKVSNFKTFGDKDIVIGDRAYCSTQGIEYLLGRKSDFLFRFGTKRSMRTYGRDEKKHEAKMAQYRRFLEKQKNNAVSKKIA